MDKKQKKCSWLNRLFERISEDFQSEIKPAIQLIAIGLIIVVGINLITMWS